MKIDKNYYPGWARKAVTFSIDDGNIEFDKKFISIVKPRGICGTFNLSTIDTKKFSPDEYRELYSGFGISNHCKYHPYALTADKDFEISDEVFDAKTADTSKRYKTDREGVYFFYQENIKGWRRVATSEAYKALVDEGKAEIEAVFGEGCVTTYVWPYHEQNDDEVKDYVMNKAGYKAVRKTGNVGDSTGFALPADRSSWSYNASHAVINEYSERFDAYSDDGELKFFCIGVHSIDYERANCWDRLEAFAERFGNRPNTYWSASVEDIFDYADAVNSLIVTDKKIENPTDIKLYIKIDGERIILAPHSKISVNL